MKLKTVIIAVVVIILLGVIFWPSGKYSVQKVVDGNTVILDNGVTVKLIGVSSSQEGMEELKRTIGRKVELRPDGSAYFDPMKADGNMTVYAYLIVPDNGYECINATLLKTKKALLAEEPFLRDSLESYRSYASNNDGGDGNTPLPNITPTPPQVIDYVADDIKLPAYTDPGERKHSAWYADGNENIAMLEEACDYTFTYTKCFANQVAVKGGEGNFNIKQACAIFDYCYKKWRYVNDPEDCEYVARASESIANSLTGDCDDFAVLMASSMLAVGGNARIITATGSSGGHAYAELDISNMNESEVLSVIQEQFSQFNCGNLNVKHSSGKVWLNLDWQASYPGGPFYNAYSWDVYTRTDGQWVWSTNY